MGIIGFIDTDACPQGPRRRAGRRRPTCTKAGELTPRKSSATRSRPTSTIARSSPARTSTPCSICVPDHWHAKMSIDAMKAGKAVYCEKPMIRGVEEGPAVIAAQKETKAVFQVGSQYASSILYDKVKELIQLGLARQGARHRGAVQPQFGHRRLAILDPDRRLARDDRLGPLPGRGAEAAVRPGAVLPLAELLGLRHGRRGRSVHPPAHRHSPRHRRDRADASRRHGRPAVLERRPRRLRHHHGPARLSRDRRPRQLHAVARHRLRGRRRRRHLVPLRRHRGRHRRQLHASSTSPAWASSTHRPIRS